MLTSPCLADHRSVIYAKGTVNSPETLEKWMKKNLEYQKDEKGYWKTPVETLKDKGGDCEDFARLVGSVLERLGYEGHIVVVLFKDKKGKRAGHAVYAFKEKRGLYRGTWSLFSNTYYVQTKSTYPLEAIFKKYRTWTRIYLFDIDKKIKIKIKKKTYKVK
jgi:hypothetical protein